MPEYVFEALDRQGNRIKGEEKAENQEEILSALFKKGYIPLSIREVRGYDTILKRLFRRVTLEDLLNFTRELGELLSAGVPLERALVILQDSFDKKEIKEIILSIKSDIQSGKSLSSALSRFPWFFDRLYVNMVAVGELGGVLPQVLKRLEEFIHKRNQIKKYIITSSIYPLILTIVGIFSVIVMVTFVVPKFSQIFNDLNQQMPLMTRIVVRISDFIRSWWWIITLGIIGIILYIRSLISTRDGRILWDNFLLNIPVLGDLIKRIEIGRFCRTLGTLIESGVPILRAINLSSEVVTNNTIRDKLVNIYMGVKQGQSISHLFKKSEIFPSLVTHLVTIGEETGALGVMFLKIADDLEEKVQNDIKTYLTLLEPITILFMGIVLGFIVLSMLLAIFGINEISF